jgi:deoxyadenosine/deoxycytidine kinase
MMPLRVEICGGIAAGKTTLSALLADAGYSVVNEDFKAVPFWRDFYRSPSKFGFQTEIGFLLQHLHQIQIATDDGRPFICDYSLVQDKSYAEVNLDQDAGKAFLAVYDYIVRRLPKPRLLIHLECEEREQLRRIGNRGRPEEAGVDAAYLAALNRAISRNASTLGDQTRLLTIDSEKYDFSANDAHRLLVQDQFREAVRSPSEP